MSEVSFSIVQYLNSFNFNQVSTYSFLGSDSDILDNETEIEVGAFGDAPTNLACEYDILEFTKNNELKLRKHATHISVLKDEDEMFFDVLTALRQNQGTPSYWMCAPVYRDLLVFETVNQKRNTTVEAILAICVTCSHVAMGDGKTFPVSDSFVRNVMVPLIALGHHKPRQ